MGFLQFLQVSRLHTSGVGRKRVGPPNFVGVFASGVKAPDETERKRHRERNGEKHSELGEENLVEKNSETSETTCSKCIFGGRVLGTSLN